MRMIPVEESKKGTVKVAFLFPPDPSVPEHEDPYTDYDHLKQHAGKFGHIIDRIGSPKRKASVKMAVEYSVRLMGSGDIIEHIPGRLLKETV